METITPEVAAAYTAPGPFRRGDSITIDPASRRIVEINGRSVPPELHTREMQAHADAELGPAAPPHAKGKAASRNQDDVAI